MSRKIKRFLGVAFILVMAFVVMTTSAFAAEGTNVAKIGDTEYATLAKAIASAKAGDTITLIADVNESVTLDKNLTIDGADNQYTGKMVANSGLNITVQNVNFVNGGVDKKAKSTTGNYTFKNCTFDGEGTYAYPLRFYGAKTLTVENCTVKDYAYSFLYVPSATLNVSVKDVTVENCPNYAVYFASGVTKATFENLTVKNSDNGFVIDNTANRAFTIKNCKMENVGTAINHSKGTKTINCTVNDVNDFGGAAISQYVKLNGVAAQNGTKIYDSLKAAVDAAKDGDTVTVAGDMTLSNTADISAMTSDRYPFISVLDKKITIDLNGKTITANPSLDAEMLAIFYTGGTGELTLVDSSDEKTGAVIVTMADGTTAYSMFTALGSSKLTIESGNYSIDQVAGQSMVYAAQNEQITINGGDFYLGNAKTRDPGNGAMQPWICNAKGDGVKAVVINGGTYNVDPTHYHGETRYPDYHLAAKLDDGKWHIVEGNVVIGTEGFLSLKDAVDDAKDGETITVHKDHKLDFAAAENVAEYGMNALVYVDKEITIDLNGKKVEGVLNSSDKFVAVFFVDGKGEANGNLTFKDASEGKIEVDLEDAYLYSMFMTNGDDAVLSFESGKYIIDEISNQGMLYATNNGTIFISGGYFELGNIGDNNETPPWFINVYGDGYGSARVTGGTFSAYPVHYHGETGILKGYEAVENEDGTWSVVKERVAVIGNNYFTSLKEAVEAAEDGDVITVIKNHEIDNSDFEASCYYANSDHMAYIEILDKKVTIDFNGKTVTANPVLDGIMSSILYVGDTGSLVLKDSSEAQNGGLDVTMGEDTKAYSLIFADEDKSNLSIESGNYSIDKIDAGYSMIYVAESGTGSVSGGDFVLGNANTIIKYGVPVPWIYNTYGNGVNFISVTGGTYNADPDNRWHEATFPKGYVSVEDENGVWKLVRGPVVIEQPADITANYGNMTKFAPVIKGVGLTYQWYYKDANGSWNKSSLTTATYDIKALATRDGRQVYCVAKDAYGKTVKTEIATLTVVPNEELVIVNQPTVVEGKLNSKVSVAIEVAGDAPTYTWYYKDTKHTKFYKSSLTTATYDITLTKDRLGRQLYCEITDVFGNVVKSDIITINGVPSVELKLLSAPVYEAAEIGEIARIKLDVQGEDLTYAWYYNLPNQTKVYKSSITDSEYAITLSKDRVGRQVYCVISDAYGNSITTEKITLVAA